MMICVLTGMWNSCAWNRSALPLPQLQMRQTDYDVVIVEGAGSPAEPNLRQGDIAVVAYPRMSNHDDIDPLASELLTPLLRHAGATVW